MHRNSLLISSSYSILRAFHTLVLVIVHCDEYAIIIKFVGINIVLGVINTVGYVVLIVTGDSSLGANLLDFVSIVAVLGVADNVACNSRYGRRLYDDSGLCLQARRRPESQPLPEALPYFFCLWRRSTVQKIHFG